MQMAAFLFVQFSPSFTYTNKITMQNLKVLILM